MERKRCIKSDYYPNMLLEGRPRKFHLAHSLKLPPKRAEMQETGNIREGGSGLFTPGIKTIHMGLGALAWPCGLGAELLIQR